MSSINIRNFGPIKEGLPDGERIELNKVTLFIGSQGSGKSSIAKLISTFSWMEMVLLRGDFSPKHFTDHNRFRKTYCAYHRIEDYFFDADGKDVASISFHGSAYAFTYESGKLQISELPSKQQTEGLPQIMYVPSERNFVSHFRNLKAFKDFQGSLLEFVSDFEVAKQSLKNPCKLPMGDAHVEYDRLNDLLAIKGDDYKVRLSDASSGYQSLVPMFIVSKYYADKVKELSGSEMSTEEKQRFKEQVSMIWESQLSEEQKREALSALAAKFNKTHFINIIEEPEQNLFPESQRDMLYSLLELNNQVAGNRLVLTTHSPYILNFLTVSIQAGFLKQELAHGGNTALLEELAVVVPLPSTVQADDVAIYQLQADGSIAKLATEYGVPSDNHMLNNLIMQGNEMFDKLLDIQERI